MTIDMILINFIPSDDDKYLYFQRFMIDWKSNKKKLQFLIFLSKQNSKASKQFQIILFSLNFIMFRLKLKALHQPYRMPGTSGYIAPDFDRANINHKVIIFELQTSWNNIRNKYFLMFDIFLWSYFFELR